MAHQELSPVRLAHLSDIHVTVRRYSWKREDWLNKRFAGWLNLRVLGRGYRFRSAERVLQALAVEIDQRRPTRIVFSGDATALGFEEEVARAAELLRVEQLPGLAVPGNHDYCTRTAMLQGHFERYFAPWQVGQRLDQTYPFAQQVDSLWLIGVNSATANRWAWDARGRVGAAQLERLSHLLEQLPAGTPRILVTHYPAVVASGGPELVLRHLRDLRCLLEVAARGGISLMLHGHRHDRYHHPRTDLAPFPIICAGSTTQTGRWSYNEYCIRGNHLSAQQRLYEPGQHCFVDGDTFELDLHSPTPVTV
jgi:3',5'-cyclic AMP phosphodiesterase CpdA